MVGCFFLDMLLIKAKDAIEENTGLPVGIEKAEQRASVGGLFGGSRRSIARAWRRSSTATRARVSRWSGAAFVTVIVARQ